MQDRPNAAELAAAIAHFLREEILPSLDDSRLQFRTRVALNALGMLEREARSGGEELSFEATTLQAHLRCETPTGDLTQVVSALNRELALRLRTGTEPAGTLPVLQDLIRRKLSIANPKAIAGRENTHTVNLNSNT